jgi:hypothetical protein
LNREKSELYEKKMYLICHVGADIHPSFRCVQPKHTNRSLLTVNANRKLCKYIHQKGFCFRSMCTPRLVKFFFNLWRIYNYKKKMMYCDEFLDKIGC